MFKIHQQHDNINCKVKISRSIDIYFDKNYN